MSNTYNPRENTFIKAPEQKTCPTCGQIYTEGGKPMVNVMNNYVSETGTIITVNSAEDIITIKDVPMYRCDENHPKTGLVHVSSILRDKLTKDKLQQQQVQQSTTVPTVTNPVPVPFNKLQAAQQVAQTTQTNP